MTDFTDIYPLGHPDDEQDRLNLQAHIHERPGLKEALAGRQEVLDLGCGVGSNLPLLEALNPAIGYVGTDLSEAAVDEARQRFPQARFEPMDATRLDFPDACFDFVFINLVLWAIGKNFTAALSEVHRVLKPGGACYCFEPDGKTLTFYPEKPAIEAVINRWESAMQASGPDPFMGRKVNSGLQTAGFNDIDTFLYSKVSVGSDPVRYKAATKNTSGVYLGPGARFVGLAEDDKIWIQAHQDFKQCNPDDLMLESYYVNIAIR